MRKSYNRADGGGDGGDTCRYGGQRVRKCHPLVVANGEIDELIAHLGLCLAATGMVKLGEASAALDQSNRAIADILDRLQADLIAVGAMMAVDAGQAPPAAVDGDDVARLEIAIAKANKVLAPLTRFIVPGGCELACRLHVARCVCRRAERSLVQALDAGQAVPPAALRYLNRLGDLLFVLARLANCAADVEELPWNQ